MKKNIKKISIFLALILFLAQNSFGLSGGVNQYDLNLKNKVIDSKTKHVLSGAKITIPQANFTTYSDENGLFQLNVNLENKTVLFVEKEGYKTFSLTVDNSVLKNPLKLTLNQTSPLDLQITDGLVHLGDNMFSDTSANSSDFKLNAKGYFLIKTFPYPKISQNQNAIIKIGSLIGLDTKKAKQKGQNRISKIYSSPMRVFVNNINISNIELNGDNIEVIIPREILKAQNELKIETGVNLFQTEYKDYDDVELANIRIEVKEKRYFAKY